MAKSLKIASENPCPKKTRVIIQIYFLLNASDPLLVVDKYIPTRDKKKAIPVNIVKLSFSGYKINAAHTGIIKDILFAIVVGVIPAFCIPNA